LLPVIFNTPALPIRLKRVSGLEFLPKTTKFQLDNNFTFLDGKVILTKLKSLKKSKSWQNVPLDKAYLL
jgi:hypothetical protein